MNRHAWREVRRQLAESRRMGAVVVLLLALAATWGSGLWLAHRWVLRELLAHGRPATVVAATPDVAAAGVLYQALAERFPAVPAAVLSPDDMRQELGAWFPELAPVLLSLDDTSFPALLKAETRAGEAEAVAAWLRERPESVVVESSTEWQARMERTLARFLAGGLALAVALLVGCVVVVVLVVRLLVLEHRDEIEVMRLIGARERDIRLPYLVSGAILGLLGGLLADAALASMWLSLRTHLGSELPIAAVLSALPPAAATVGLAGAALGLAALPSEP